MNEKDSHFINFEKLNEKEQQIVDVVKEIYDPEIPISIYDLGLIYSISTQDGKNVSIQMTLTSPNCPVAQSLPAEVETKISAIPGIENVTLEIVWDPMWSGDMISEAGQLELGIC
jgi:FeS assembly SUF system protein